MTYGKTLIGLSLAGMLFAGYLAGVKVFTSTCSALVGSCAYFLGVPTCIYGFTFFSILFVLSFAMFYLKRRLYGVIALVAFAAMIFASYFTITEWVHSGPFPLFAPTCFYGLLVYIAIFVLSAGMIKKK